MEPSEEGAQNPQENPVPTQFIATEIPDGAVVSLDSIKANYEGVRNLPSEMTPQLEDMLSKVLSEMQELQKVARETSFNLSDQQAQHLTRIVVLGGPGTYLDKTFENDKYPKDWAAWMSRKRLNKAAQLARRIAQSRSGLKNRLTKEQLDVMIKREEEDTARSQVELIGDDRLSKASSSLGRFTDEEIAQTRQLVSQYGPDIYFTGGEAHNDPLNKFRMVYPTIIDENKLHLTKGQIYDTVEELSTLNLFENYKVGDVIGLVTHAPHVPRVMRLIAAGVADGKIPAHVKFHIFPLPSPPQSEPYDFEKSQAGGVLNDVFVRKIAAVQPFPYTI